MVFDVLEVGMILRPPSGASPSLQETLITSLPTTWPAGAHGLRFPRRSERERLGDGDPERAGGE